MPPGATTLETFADFRDWKASHPDEAENYQRQFDEAAALKFLKDPKTSKEVRNLAFAYFTPDEFPTHRMLQELMMLDPMGAERDQIMEIATLLLPWCRDGNYGCLFDGTSNLSLTGKIAHFELGYIPESAKELKAAAGFLITNHARKHIMTLPRAIAETERLRGSRPLPRHSRRTGNRSGELRAASQVQLLEHLHRAAICAVQTEPHPLGRVRQLAASSSSCGRTTARTWTTWARTSRCPK